MTAPDEQAACEILRVLYPDEAVFLTGISDFSQEQRSVVGGFVVGSSRVYTVTPIPYVTGEQLLRCVNQLSYVLMGLLVRDEVEGFRHVDYSSFVKAMAEYRMWLAEHRMSHDTQVPKDDEFAVSLKVTRARVVIGGLSVVCIEFSGPISGELKFAARI